MTWKRTLIFFIPLAVILFILVGYKYYSNRVNSKLIKPSPSAQTKNLDKQSLSGKILYQNENTVQSFDPKTTKNTFILNLDENDLLWSKWAYQNGEIFYSSGSGLTRFDLATKKTEFVAIVDDKTAADWKTKIQYFARSDSIFPSPDNSKVAIIVPGSGYLPGKLYLINFSDNSSKYLMTDPGKPQWFSDGRYLYSGSNDGSVIDTETGIIKNIPNLDSNLITVAKTEYAFLWFSILPIKHDTMMFSNSRKPDMILSSLKNTFPNINSQYISYNLVTPFSSFPVIARDFKSINKVIPGDGRSFFYIEIDDGKSNIYATDGSGTFKKITPNNPYSYALLNYDPNSKKILAIKYRLIPQDYPNTKLQMNLVLVDPGNYSETVAGIDTANFFEKELLTLDSANGSPDYYSKSQVTQFSPDGKYILVPQTLGGTGPLNYAIISTDGTGKMNIGSQLGEIVYWIN